MSSGFKSRRLKIVEPGLDNYTGPIGGIDFENGVSTDLVSWRVAHEISSGFRVVDADNEDYQIGPVAEIERIRDMLADDAVVKSVDTGVVINGETTSVAIHKFSRQDLEAIADQKGLHGVRTIANAWKRTGRSILECIDAILEAQGDNPAQSTIAGPGED